jgi:tRNA1(Val) A37 N6-methylase TrmN6
MQLKDNEVLEELFGDKKIIQNKTLYRFTSDSILLSKFVKGKKGDVVADFCSGSGIVGLHFACLNGHISGVTLFEMQSALSDMAARTIEYNGFTNIKSVNCKLQDIPPSYDGKFSLILCNPPYETGGYENLTYEKAICRKEITITLPEIIDIAYKKLKYGGRLAIINRADRTGELMYLLKNRGLEPKRMQLIAGTPSSKPYLIMVEATKGGKSGVEVLPVAVNDGTVGTTNK